MERPSTPSAACTDSLWSSVSVSAGPSSPTAAASAASAGAQPGGSASPRRQSTPFDVLLLAAQLSSSPKGTQTAQRRRRQAERRSRTPAPPQVLAAARKQAHASTQAAVLRPAPQVAKRVQLPRRYAPAATAAQLCSIIRCLALRQQRLHLISSGVATAVASLPPQDAAELQAARTFLSLF
ncbi:hypothetical protein ABPG75_007299 [Micractinium tetrahymenae]